jgi:hypothetical protein
MRAFCVAGALLLGVAHPMHGQGGEMRQWNDRAGRKFDAEIVANDALRVTLRQQGGAKIVLPLQQLSAADAEIVSVWRSRNPDAPLVDPDKLAPWPANAMAANVEVRSVSDTAKPGPQLYEGAHFSIHSGVRLPLGVIGDLNAVFEATRAALIALPLGLHRGGERGKYHVFLFPNAAEYGRAGGGSASGGYYDGRTDRMLILLPNLGIRVEGAGAAFDYRKNLFILKHEVTHQLLRHWRGFLPMWFNEGLAEVIAATPYAQGQYTFSGLDTALAAYVKKWRRPGDTTPLAITPPADLLSLTRETWEARVGTQNAYDIYNSAGLFTYFLLRHEGAGDGRRVASMLEALRQGASTEDAVARHLRVGWSDKQMAAEFAVFLRRRGLTFEFAPEPGSR